MKDKGAANPRRKNVQEELHSLHLELDHLRAKITEIKEDILILNPGNVECVCRLLEKIKRL